MSIIKTIASILDGRGGTPVGVENVARRPPPSATNPNPAGQPSGLYKGAMSREQLRVDVPVPDTGGELKVTVLPKAEASGLDLSGVPFPTMEQDLAFRAAVLERGFQVPADVITLLDELDEPWLRLQEAFAKFSTSNAKTDYFKALAATAEGIASGDRTAEDADNFTLSEWAEDYAQKRTAMKKSTRDIELQARRIAAPVLVEYGAALDALATELEAPLRAQAESYKCPFRPPNFVLLMRKSAELARSGNWLSVGRPKRLLERLKA